MSAVILDWAVCAAQVMLALAMAAAAWRLLRGPRAQDRVLALDSLYLSAMLLLVTFGIRTGSTALFRGGAGHRRCSASSARVALAKFLMRGEVIE